ncbi:MAG: hypothetical protein AB1650_00170 [Candidatus Omnitrophota bacterium]
MNYLEFRKIAGNQHVIDMRNVVNYFGSFDRRRLYEWQQKGYITKITNDFYLFSDVDVNEDILRDIASKIYQPSYIGLESAMAYYRFIPEAVFQTISVTTQRNKFFKTSVGDFRYRAIKENLFFGYRAVEAGSDHFFISDPEKTILDMFYFLASTDRRVVIESLRLNFFEIRSNVSLEKMAGYLKLFSSRKMNKAFQHFKEMLNAES